MFKNFFIMLSLMMTMVISSAASGVYEVYPGCESPSASYSKSIYVDPNLGNDTTGDGSPQKPFKTLSSIISKKLLKGGEHLYLLAGSYGDIALPVIILHNWYQMQIGFGLIFNPVL